MNLFDIIYDGQNQYLQLAEEMVAKVVAEKGKDTPVKFPGTAYALPCIYAITGKKITNVGELEDALVSAREHNLLTELDLTVSSFLAFSKENHFPNWGRLLKLYSSYYDYKPENIDNIIKGMKDEAAKTKIAFENGESFAEIFDDLDDDDDLDSIFGEDDDDWDDDDEDFDKDDEQQPIRKATPKEKNTKLF